jgi:hypothetical protein
MAGQVSAGKLALSTSCWIWGVGGYGAHRRRWATMSYTVAGKKSMVGRTSGCWHGSLGRRGTTKAREAASRERREEVKRKRGSSARPHAFI